MSDWHESQESWARLVAELRAENASLHIHQCRDLESGRERDALVERLQRTIGESMGEADRLRAELALQNEARMQAVRDMDEAEAELADWQTACQLLNATVEQQDAAIARVREEADKIHHEYHGDLEGASWIASRMLHALDGGTE